MSAAMDVHATIWRIAEETNTLAKELDSPDAELLAVCAAILDLRKLHKEMGPVRGDAVENEVRIAGRARIETHVRPLMIRAGKLPIITPAGLYAKASVLLSSYGAAPRLAQAIAASILEQPALRRVLWPAPAPEAATEPVPGLDGPRPARPEAANDPAPEPPPWKRQKRRKGGA
jgi:hypothetical protein